jgi:hypothetical protein
MLLAIAIIAVVFAVVMIVVLYSEEKDKQYRRLSGLPPKRYHDITDLDSTELHLQNILNYVLEVLYRR